VSRGVIYLNNGSIFPNISTKKERSFNLSFIIESNLILANEENAKPSSFGSEFVQLHT
jgi:hypothetical protein